MPINSTISQIKVPVFIGPLKRSQIKLAGDLAPFRYFLKSGHIKLPSEKDAPLVDAVGEAVTP